MRGATRSRGSCPRQWIISIHAPLAGSDVINRELGNGKLISIHAPLAGSDFPPRGRSPRRSYFNPRSPCGERPMACVIGAFRFYFNPRSPCGERLVEVPAAEPAEYFNPRSPCGERLRNWTCALWDCDFNPRSPCGERRTRRPPRRIPGDFNPRSPCGERPSLFSTAGTSILFQSTLPLRGATVMMSRRA